MNNDVSSACSSPTRRVLASPAGAPPPPTVGVAVRTLVYDLATPRTDGSPRRPVSPLVVSGLSSCAQSPRIQLSPYPSSSNLQLPSGAPISPVSGYFTFPPEALSEPPYLRGEGGLHSAGHQIATHQLLHCASVGSQSVPSPLVSTTVGTMSQQSVLGACGCPVAPGTGSDAPSLEDIEEEVLDIIDALWKEVKRADGELNNQRVVSPIRRRGSNMGRMYSTPSLRRERAPPKGGPAATAERAVLRTAGIFEDQRRSVVDVDSLGRRISVQKSRLRARSDSLGLTGSVKSIVSVGLSSSLRSLGPKLPPRVPRPLDPDIAESMAIRSQNVKLQKELSMARRTLELHTSRVNDTLHRKEQENQKTCQLESVVDSLHHELEAATERAHQLEHRVASMHSELKAKPLSSAPPSAAASVTMGSARMPSKSESDGTEVVEKSITECEVKHGTDDDEELWEFVVQGRLCSGGQAEQSRKGVTCFPACAMERVRACGTAFICARGRRLDTSAPNQDDLVLAMCRCPQGGRVGLFGVFDGHGPSGHLCASFARGFLPERIFGDPSLLTDPEGVLKLAFEETHRGLLAREGRMPAHDKRASGTTATVALVLDFPNSQSASAEIRPKESPRSSDVDCEEAECAGVAVHGEGVGEIAGEHRGRCNGDGASANDVAVDRGKGCWVFVAHVGDSRAVLGSTSKSTKNESEVVAASQLTTEHRPDDAAEAARVENAGGVVRRLKAGRNTSRIFFPSMNQPGLALTRVLGDTAVGEFGVTAVPEVVSLLARPGKDILLLLGTDGFFEFCSPDEAVSRLMTDGIKPNVLEALCVETRRRWAQNSYNQTCDDATAIAVSLSSWACNGR